MGPMGPSGFTFCVENNNNNKNIEEKKYKINGYLQAEDKYIPPCSLYSVLDWISIYG